MKKDSAILIRIDDVTKKGLDLLSRTFKLNKSEIVRLLIAKEVTQIYNEMKKENEHE